MIICADDFGVFDSVDCAVLELLERGAISAVSCVVTMPSRSGEFSSRAAAMKERASVGLHFVLCDLPTFSLPMENYPSFLRRCLFGKVEAFRIRSEFRLQLDAFIRAYGFFPAHIDGHMHCHQLPVVRDVILSELSDNFGKERVKPWIRGTRPPPSRALLALPVRTWLFNLSIGTFSAGLEYSASLRGIRHTDHIFGLMGFSAGAAVKNNLRAYLRIRPSQSDLLVVHPGAKNASRDDPIAQHRLIVFDYLRSSEFMEDLNRHDLSLRAVPSRAS
jgi:predicted glycoside hydrolase/deacetylase ChbG (UPF0249 family)